jgi:hypothetical protein
VTRRRRITARFHHIADRARRARPARELGHIAVCRDVSRRDPPYDRQHALSES